MPPKGTRKVSNHKCQYCSYRTHRRSFMNDHVRVHTGEKPFRCETCGKAFSQKSNLRQHLKVHNQGNQRVYRCKRCDFETKWKSSLQVHDRMHNGEKPYKCKICDRAFSQSTHCQTHMREAHLNMRKFQCEVCSKTFKRHEHLERHMAFHKMARDFECDICHKKYLDARYLKQHRLIHEGDASKIYSCGQCSYKSRYKQGLRIHMRTHTGQRPYKCDDCSKAFVTQQIMKLHHRMVHQGLAGKIFHCDLCPFKTANKPALMGHLRKIHHRGQQAIKCKVCLHVFYGMAAVNKHMLMVHPKFQAEEQRLRQEGKAAVKVIGSLSRSNGTEGSLNNNNNAKNRMMIKLKKRAVSPKSGNFHFGSVTIKQEPVDEDVKPRPEELAEGTLGRNIHTMVGGRTGAIEGIEEVTVLPRNQQGGQSGAEKAVRSNGVAALHNGDIGGDVENRESSDYDVSISDISSEVEVVGETESRNTKRAGKDFPRIKLNSPKGSNKKPSNKGGSSTAETSPASASTIKLSPGSDRSKSKSPVPSAERARKLFVNPSVYIDRDDIVDPSVPTHRHNGASASNAKNNDDDLMILDHFEKQPPLRSRECRQFDSLREIVSAFHPCLMDSINQGAAMETRSNYSSSEMVHETIEGENGELIEVHMMKEESANDAQN